MCLQSSLNFKATFNFKVVQIVRMNDKSQDRLLRNRVQRVEFEVYELITCQPFDRLVCQETAVRYVELLQLAKSV